MTNHPDVAGPVSQLVGAPASLIFGLFLVLHVTAGLTCVVSGVTGFMSRKVPGRHPRSGDVYYLGLAVVFATASGMAFMHWAESAHLFVLGCMAFGFGSLGYLARKRRWPGWFTIHAVGMSASYIVLLTAFYVDNGPKLPLWQLLPPLVFWVAPTAIGVPLLIRALRRRHRFAADVRATARAAAAALAG